MRSENHPALISTLRNDIYIYTYTCKTFVFKISLTLLHAKFNLLLRVIGTLLHVGAVDPAAEHRSRGESERDVLRSRPRARRGQTYTLSRPERLRERDGGGETATVSERDGRSTLGRQRRETLPAERVEREKDGENARNQRLKKDG